MSKPVIAIYSGMFLSISMTFIHRQIMGITRFFKPIVLTASKINSEVFPFSPVYEKRSPQGLIGRATNKLYRVLTRKYTSTTRAQLEYWSDACRNNNVRLIHAHFGYCGLQMLPLARSLGVPLVVTFHGKDASALLNNDAYRNNLKSLFDYAYVICVSEVIKSRLEKYGLCQDTVKVHYIGVPLDDFKLNHRKPLKIKCQNREKLEFLQVSNFVEKKGHLCTVEAFSRFLRFYPNAHLTLAGDGYLGTQIKKRCSELSISDKVSFKGQVVRSQVVELMRHSDVFLHHSVTARNGDQEGIPTVLMEAMATGLVVVSTYHAGIPELIDDGVDGFLVREGDIEAYEKKLTEILQSDQNIGINARKKVESKFDMEKQNDDLAEIYRAILAQP